MTNKPERLYVFNTYPRPSIVNRAEALKKAEIYCANPPAQHLVNDEHTYWKDGYTPSGLAAIVCSLVGIFASPLFFTDGFVHIAPAIFLLPGAGFWFLSGRQWEKRRQKLLDQYEAYWQKQQNLTTDKLSLAAKNLKAISDFFNRQADRFSKYQRYIENGAVSLDETQLAERKILADRLNAIHDKINKRINQLDYLLDAGAESAIEEEVVKMIDFLGQSDIGNEIAKLLDPRFRTLTEAEMETRALTVLEELPQRI